MSEVDGKSRTQSMFRRTRHCFGCMRERGEIPRGIRSRHFDVHQDYEIPIPGFLIVSSQRHIMSIDDFTASEQRDFIQLLCRVRAVMRKSLAINTILLVQDEATSHHFHVWLLPRYPWMKRFGRSIESIRPIIEYARIHMQTKANQKKIARINDVVRRSLHRA